MLISCLKMIFEGAVFMTALVVLVLLLFVVAALVGAI